MEQDILKTLIDLLMKQCNIAVKCELIMKDKNETNNEFLFCPKNSEK